MHLRTSQANLKPLRQRKAQALLPATLPWKVLVSPVSIRWDKLKTLPDPFRKQQDPGL